MGTGVFTFTLPLMNLDEKAGGMWLGSGFAGYFLAKLLIAPLSGSLADRYGIKKPLLISTGVAVLLPLIYLSFPLISSLYIIQFALGLCAGTVRTVSMAAIGSSMHGKQLSSNFANLAVAMNSSFLLGPILGGLLYLDKNYFPVLISMSSFMIAAFILYAFYRPEKISLQTDKKEQHSRPESGKSYIYIMLALFGRATGIGGLIAFYPLLIKSSLNLSPGAIAVIYSIPSLTTVILLPVCGRLLAERERRLTTCWGMLISSLGLFLVAGAGSLSGFIFPGIIMGAGAAISMPSAMAICSELGTRKGKIMGFANMATNIGFMAGPLFCGTLVTLSGHLTSPFKLIAIGGSILTLPLLYQGLRTIKASRTVQLVTIFFTLLLLLAVTLHLNLNFNMQEKTYRGTFRYSDIAMGTMVNLTLVTPIKSDTERIAQEVVTLMHKLQKDLDHRSKLGSIGRVNHAAGKRGIKISDKAFQVIKHGLEMGEKSDGNFDISIGAVTTTPFYYALDKDRFSKHKKLVNFRLIEINDSENMVKLPRKGMAIDLGGLAKGTIIDAAADHLKQSGIHTAMVEAGGDFMVFGNRLWSIGIRNPRGDGILGHIEVKDSAVCGSGDYYQFITPVSADEKTRKHHIFDPARLESSDKCIATTTIAPDAETADALATTVFIMGPNKGADFIKKHFPKCAAMWVQPDMSIKTTENFPIIRYQ